MPLIFLGFMVLRGILWIKSKLKDVEVFPKELLFCFYFKIEFQEIEIHQDGVLSFPFSINSNVVLIELDFQICSSLVSHTAR